MVLSLHLWRNRKFHSGAVSSFVGRKYIVALSTVDIDKIRGRDYLVIYLAGENIISSLIYQYWWKRGGCYRRIVPPLVEGQQVAHGIILPLIAPSLVEKGKGKNRHVVLYPTLEGEELPYGAIPPLLGKRAKKRMMVPSLHLWKNE